MLAYRLLRAFGRILGDRLQEVLGRALPRTPGDLARPEVVNALLRGGATPGAASLPPVCSVRLPGVAFESSNCQNFLIAVEFGVEEPQGAALPETVYVKLPCAELPTRVFADAVGFWNVEAEFCQNVASDNNGNYFEVP